MKLLIKLRSLFSPRNLREGLRIKISDCAKDNAKFLSVKRGVGEPDDDFLARLREEARY